MRPEIARILAIADRTEFVAACRQLCHDMQDELTRDELYLLLGYSLGRLLRADAASK